MRPRTNFLIAVGLGMLGLAGRWALPVTPVDEAFRDVLRFYQTLEPH